MGLVCRNPILTSRTAGMYHKHVEKRDWRRQRKMGVSTRLKMKMTRKISKNENGQQI